MAVLGKTVKDVYDAVLFAYQTCKDKKQGANDALAIYEQNLEFIEETKRILVDMNDFVEILQESLNEQKSNSKTKKTVKTKGSLVAKLVLCGKECNGCPHGPYLYRVSRVNGKQVWKHLGHADFYWTLHQILRESLVCRISKNQRLKINPCSLSCSPFYPGSW